MLPIQPNNPPNMPPDHDSSSEESIEIVPVLPGKSMGVLNLGMSRENLYKTLQKQITSLNDTMEFFPDIGLRVEYDKDQVTLLESDGTWPLFIDDFNIFSSAFSDCVQFLKAKDSTVEETDELVNSNLLGIGIMTNKTADQPPYLVAIFSPSSSTQEK